LSEISHATLDYVHKHAEGESYTKFLQQRFPFSPRPIDIPNYKADHGQQIALADDMVGIRAEVDAFAYLLASRGLKPPLAVGLFGDWGSGKSFFMEAVRKRIEQLTRDPQAVERPQSEVPMWKRIIQIEFNAWHYVEGELWASLVDHIFNQLKLGDKEESTLVEQRRKHWLDKLDHTRAKMARLESKRNEAERNLRDKEQQAELLRRQRDSELANLERLRSQAATEIVVEKSIGEVKKAIAPFLIAIGVPTAEEVFKKLDEARAELKRGHVLLDTLWNDKQHRQGVIGCLVGVPVLVWILSWFNFDAVEAAFGGISAALTATLTLLTKATGLVRSRLNVLETVQSKVNDEIAEVQKELQRKINGAEKNISEAEKRLKSVIDEQQTLAENLDTIQKELEQVTPARVLTDFVAERVGSGDYRKHLGIPALIQQDFRQLAELVAEQNKDILSGEKKELEKSDDCFNRIILYIDDRDRCPDEHVIEVLQAVHLLLAFELFVVVVAVDSRWLSHALTKHFEALVVDRANGQEATPDDYLEKIFQIPFWIQPLGESAKRNIIQGLLRGHLTSVAGQGGEERGGDKPTVGKEEREVLKTLDPASAPPTLEAAALSITADELRFLDTLAALLGTTPRSTKRFVNLYQLARIIYRLDPNAYVATQPPDYALLAFVLALGEGLPKLGPIVLKEALKAEPTDTFEMLITKTRTQVDDAQAKRLDTWLASRPEWKQISAERMAEAFRKIDRFLFRVGTSYQPPKSENQQTL
jgi:KAP-like P-loop domain-containing protein